MPPSKQKMVSRDTMKVTKAMAENAAHVIVLLATLPMGSQGVVQCHKCGGKLHWRRNKRAKSGVCETNDCIQFRSR